MTHTRGTGWAAWARRLRMRHGGVRAWRVPMRLTFARAAAGGVVVSRIAVAPVTVRLSVHPVLRFDYRPSLRPSHRLEREREIRTHATIAGPAGAAVSVAAAVPPAEPHRTAPPPSRPERADVPRRASIAAPLTPTLLRRRRIVVEESTRAVLSIGRTVTPVVRRVAQVGPAAAPARLGRVAPAALLPELRALRQRVETAPAAAPRQLARRPHGAPVDSATAPASSPPTPAAATAAGGAPGTTVAPSPAISVPDVGRLTEQVIREIDRRILAHRERMGRGAF